MYNEYSYPYIIKKRSIGFGLRRPRRTLQAGTSRSRRLDFVAGHSDCSTTFIIGIRANSIREDINLGVDIMSLMQLIFYRTYGKALTVV